MARHTTTATMKNDSWSRSFIFVTTLLLTTTTTTTGKKYKCVVFDHLNDKGKCDDIVNCVHYEVRKIT